MKRFFSLILAIYMAVFVLVGCNGGQGVESQKISIVTTVFPQYDWVKQIIGNTDNIELTLLTDTGVDMHSFQPSAEDVFKISNADLFVYVGGESDKWVKNVLSVTENKNMQVIELVSLLGEKAIELAHSHNENEEAHTEYDEHVWMSIKNAKTYCLAIANKLCLIDTENAETYKTNLNQYLEDLDCLEKEYAKAVQKANKKALIFTDRFAFAYLVKDYQVPYFAAFDGCSSETEADFETILSLAKRVDEFDLSFVITTDNASTDIAKTVIENTKKKNQQILSLNSMQTITLNQAENGESYLNIMKSNLEIIKRALS